MVVPMATNAQRWLRLEQLDRRAAVWRSALQQAPVPQKGWIYTMRTALGMTQEQLAKRMGVAKSRIGQIEKAEVEGSLTIATLRRAAEALGARAVVGMTTEQPLESRIEAQAEQVARRMLSEVDHTMALEAQQTGPAHQQHELKWLKDELLAGPWRVLWS